jgi:hypothetical protein
MLPYCLQANISVMYKTLPILMSLVLVLACKKDKKEAPYPTESYLKLTVDGTNYEYSGKELGGGFARGSAIVPANFMMYTQAMDSSSTKPGFYIMGDAPGLTTVGKYLVVDCLYIVSSNGPVYKVRNSLDPTKSQLNLTRVSPNEMIFEGVFSIEVTDTATNDIKLTNGSFGIVVQ